MIHAHCGSVKWVGLNPLKLRVRCKLYGRTSKSTFLWVHDPGLAGNSKYYENVDFDETSRMKLASYLTYIYGKTERPG